MPLGSHSDTPDRAVPNSAVLRFAGEEMVWWILEPRQPKLVKDDGGGYHISPALIS
jgi:hypothetical protein